VQTEAEIDQMMRRTGPAVGLLLDTGHAAYAGIDPLALARRYAKRINHVHCKDVRRPVLDRSLQAKASFLDSVLDGVFTVPGDGAIDFPPILNVLADAGYAGWLVVEAEQDPAKAHPLTYAKMGFQNLSRMAREAGFAVV
jgi:inosose dehydratase